MVQFQKANLNTPFVKKIIKELADKTGQDEKLLRTTLKIELEERLKQLNGPDSFHEVAKQNAIEAILFDKIKDISKDEEFNYEHFNYLFKSIIVKNKAFSNVRDRVTGKMIKFNLIMTPPRKVWIKQADWIKSITTAAATPQGDLIFNTDFAKQLITYAKLKGIKPKGRVYQSNGGKVPDSYAYIEFLILHEIYHIIHADHFHQSNKEGMTGTMQNWLGDFLTNYKLVKAGYDQLPIGLFSNVYNYDNFNSMSEMQDRIIEDFKKMNEDQKKDMNKQMDDHVDKNGEKTNSDESVEQEEKQQSQDGQEQDSQSSDNNGGQGDDNSDSQGNSPDEGEGSDSDSQSSGSSNSEENSEESEEQSDKKSNSTQQSNDENLDGSYKNAQNEIPDADEMSAEEIDKAIKEMENKNKTSSEDLKKTMEENRRKNQEKLEAKKRELDKKTKAKPISWKKLLKSMIPKEEKVESTSMTKMHRRTVAQMGMATGKRGIAVKAGKSYSTEPSQSLLYILDFSGSMSSVFNRVSQSILKILKDSNKLGIKDFYIICFASDYTLFKVNLDEKKMTYQKVINRNEFSKKNFKFKLDKIKRPIEQIFDENEIGIGTEFPDDLLEIMLKLKKQDFNQVIITDSDIAWEGNMKTLRKACLSKGKPFSFNVLLRDVSSYNTVVSKLGFRYKYISYIED